MLLFVTSDAEQFATRALDEFTLKELAKLDKVLTSAPGTALDARIGHRELTAVPLLVLG